MNNSEQSRIELQFNTLKELIQHSNINKNFHGIIIVTKSRFRKILSDYYSLHAIEVEGSLDNNVDQYRDFILTELDTIDKDERKHNNHVDRGNSYKVVRSNIPEKKGNCLNCTCKKRRWLNPETGDCYYNEMIKDNYTTKLK